MFTNAACDRQDLYVREGGLEEELRRGDAGYSIFVDMDAGQSITPMCDVKPRGHAITGAIRGVGLGYLCIC